MGIQARNPNEDDEESDVTASGEPIDAAYDGGVGAPLLTQVDHVAIVVEDLAEAIAEHRDGFGVLVTDREELFDEGAEVAFLEVGGSSIMLIAPTTDDSVPAALERLAELHRSGALTDEEFRAAKQRVLEDG